MIIFGKFQQVVYETIIISKNTTAIEMIAIDLSKQQELDSDPKQLQPINFTGNLAHDSTIFFIIEEAKETVLDFSQGTIM